MQHQNSDGNTEGGWTSLLTNEDVLVSGRSGFPWISDLHTWYQSRPWKNRKDLELEIASICEGGVCLSGLVWYISVFLPKLMEYTSMLTPLTSKSCNALFPPWTVQHEAAFLWIRDLVLSADYLTTIDHDNPGKKKIWVTCEASQWRMGACLSFGNTWEWAQPVAFKSQQMNAQQRRYSTHEQELLSIIWALKKWCVDLLGTHINIYTNHCTLEKFNTQRDLSRHQCCWQEFLAQYDYTISYIKGEDNMITDALSQLLDMDSLDTALPTDPNNILLATVLSILSDDAILKTIQEGYNLNPFCIKLKKSPTSCPMMSLHSVQHPFTPFYDTPYIYALQVYNAIRPSLQIRSTLTLSNGLPLLSLLSQYRQRLTHDRVWVSPIATPMDEPWNNGHSLQSLSLSLLNTMHKHCNQFVRPFTLFSDKLYLAQSWSS